ncbi:MAG: hypothetical protein JSW51_06605 [Gemmatimonadota bacterium]|nr:MAG: hypothetical protein JSW51_06605 [Gemmatimonadota bacterium]
MHTRRELLKIPATARFCERSIMTSQLLSDWTVAAASMGPSHIRVLIRLPLSTKRKQIVQSVKRAAAHALRKSGIVSRWQRVVWGQRSWCFVLRSATSVAAVRRHMSARNATIGSLFPTATHAELVRALTTSVGEDTAGRTYDIIHVR